MELTNRYLTVMVESIDAHGGYVDKFIGDAVMAVWGAPVAREDDPERAVRGALELVDAVRSLGPGIQARAGVLTGEAAVTLGAVGQGMVAGDLVNTASRVQALASPGAVLVGEATRRATEQAIVFEAAGWSTLGPVAMNCAAPDEGNMFILGKICRPDQAEAPWEVLPLKEKIEENKAFPPRP
jgi:class 3 adenylate cyclase